MPKQRGRPKKHTSRVSTERIIAAARRLTIASGKLPSIRSIAAHLDVDPMAIYHYFESKQALLEHMASSIVDAVYSPESGPDWENELCKLAISYVDQLRKHPGLLEAMLASPVVGPVVLFSERFEAATADLALSEPDRRHALYLFVDYLHGFAYSATCAGALADQLSTEEVTGPLRVLFRGMQPQD